MKKLFIGLGVLLMLFVSSCDSSKSGDELKNSSVKFNVVNLMQTSGVDASKLTDNKFDLPECKDEPVGHIDVTIDGEHYEVPIDEDFESEEIKLAAGIHIISEFAIMAQNGAVIYAAPQAGSDVATLFDIQGIDIEFETKAFEKKKVDIDVLCYEPAYYQEFGFNWFTYSTNKIKEVCFYVNLCRDNYEEWHDEGSIYEDQEYDGKYFSGIIEVTIEGENFSNTSSNIDWLGNGRPLCVEYIDVDGRDDVFTFYIELLLPDGSKILIHSGTFTDQDSDFGGADGVYDIRLDCEDEATDCSCDWDCDPSVFDNERVEICHKVSIGNDEIMIPLVVPSSAVEAHLAHGDSIGSCDDYEHGDDD